MHKVVVRNDISYLSSIGQFEVSLREMVPRVCGRLHRLIRKSIDYEKTKANFPGRICLPGQPLDRSWIPAQSLDRTGQVLDSWTDTKFGLS